jgi:adenylyl-sulfate kinase
MNTKHNLDIYKGATLWFTGYPCSGKTTIAKALCERLESLSVPVILLDGDEVRPIIGADLDYSSKGRGQSLQRYIDLCRILLRARALTIVSVNNHAQTQREQARAAFPLGRFFEVWVDTPLDICKERDVKGLYKAAIEGKVSNVVGVDIVYESPQSHDLRVTSLDCSADDSALTIIQHLLECRILVRR